MMIQLFKYRQTGTVDDVSCLIRRHQKKTTYLRRVETGCLPFIENVWSTTVVDVGDSERMVGGVVYRRKLSFREGDMLETTASANFMM